MINAELALADVYYKKKEYGLSADYLKRVITTTPGSLRAYLMLGNCMLAAGNYGDAELNFQKALTLDARSVAARYYLALTKERSGRYGEAIPMYRVILEERPHMADVGLRLANLLGRENRSSEALAIFDELVRKHPENGYLKFILGNCYRSSGDIDNAVNYYRLAVNNSPELIEGYAILADLQPDSAKKIAIIKDAIEKVPHSIELKMIIANIYFKAGNLDSALTVLEPVYSLNPHNSSIANNLAWLYLEKGTNLTKAYELARSAFESQPDNPYYAHTLGWAYHKKKINKQAEWYLRESIRLIDNQGEKKREDHFTKSVFSYHLAILLFLTRWLKLL